MKRSKKSIPEQLRDLKVAYIKSKQCMEILGIGKSAYYAQVDAGLIPVTRWGRGFRIDPFVLADKLEAVTS